MRSSLLTIALAALAQVAFAQDKPATDTSTEIRPTEEETAAPRHSIRVLHNPYDLASFYRSGGSAPGGWAGLANDPTYAIAGFYRQGGSRSSRYGWSAFWTNGYSARRPTPFLAPVGPISGAFFDH